jgi:hypothetical protein
MKHVMTRGPAAISRARVVVGGGQRRKSGGIFFPSPDAIRGAKRGAAQYLLGLNSENRGEILDASEVMRGM